MEYRYGKNENYEDFSSGRVIYGGAGVPNFPVRLAIEIFGRCLDYKSRKNELTVYDPCCGGGYLLTVLGFHYPEIFKLVGSDVDEAMLSVAEKNFSCCRGRGWTDVRRSFGSWRRNTVRNLTGKLLRA